jgi:hypothetical protein
MLSPEQRVCYASKVRWAFLSKLESLTQGNKIASLPFGISLVIVFE